MVPQCGGCATNPLFGRGGCRDHFFNLTERKGFIFVPQTWRLHRCVTITSADEYASPFTERGSVLEENLL
jgi:hypothetical protein